MRVLLGLGLAGLVAGAFAPAHAEQWCGFRDKAHERVRCGYSSLQQCRQVLADKNRGKKDSGTIVICLPDPARG